MPLTIIDGPIIAAGESLSSAVDCSAGELVRLTMPVAWTPARLTFQISSDGQYFNDLYGPHGEVAINVVPGAAIVLSGGIGRAGAYIKFRSGTVNHPIIQETGRQFAVAVWT